MSQEASEALEEGIMQSDTQKVRAALQRPCSPNAVDKNGWRPLHRALALTRRGDYAPRTIVHLLLEARASVNMEQDSHETPLHVACRRNAIDMVLTLVDAKADLAAVKGVERKSCKDIAMEMYHFELYHTLVVLEQPPELQHTPGEACDRCAVLEPYTL